MPEIDRIYTIELAVNTKEQANDEQANAFISKAYSVAKKIFAELQKKTTFVLEQSAKEVENQKIKLMKSGNIPQARYSAYINLLQTQEENTNLWLQEQYKVEEHIKFNRNVENSNAFSKVYSDTSDIWKIKSHFAKLGSSNNILMKYYDSKTKKCLVEYIIRINDFSVYYPVEFKHGLCIKLLSQISLRV